MPDALPGKRPYEIIKDLSGVLALAGFPSFGGATLPGFSKSHSLLGLFLHAFLRNAKKAPIGRGVNPSGHPGGRTDRACRHRQFECLIQKLWDT